MKGGLKVKLLCFGATWCASCLVMEPRINEVAEQMPELEVIYYDYDLDIDAVRKWKVRDVLPTYVLIDKEGKELMRIVGEKSKEYLIKIIEECKNKIEA